MLDVRIRAIVEAIHASPAKAVITLAGGASQVLGWLLSVPGASNTVLEALVPYSKNSLCLLLGKVPEHFVSKEVVQEMATLAFNRALKLSRPGCLVVGVGFSGSLASSNLKRGEHRFFVSTRTSNRLWVSYVKLHKGLRSRDQEDTISSNFILKAIADACQISMTSESELTEGEDAYEFENLFDEDQELGQLVNGEICMKVDFEESDLSLMIKEYGLADTHKYDSEQKVILSGSFNPLHDGHLKLLEVAASVYCDRAPCFEISVINADKPPLSIAEIKERVNQFKKYGKTVILTNQPYFYKKAELFPGSAFVIGADTAARLIQPKYYSGSYDQMKEVLNDCKKSLCTFLVGGRQIDGHFKVLEDLAFPKDLMDMFISIPEEEFRVDVSSTEIRKKLEI